MIWHTLKSKYKEASIETPKPDRLTLFSISPFHGDDSVLCIGAYYADHTPCIEIQSTDNPRRKTSIDLKDLKEVLWTEIKLPNED